MNKQDLKDFLAKYDTVDAKVTALQDAADGVEKISYVRRLTADELRDKRYKLSEAVISIKDLLAEKKKLNDEIKLREKPLSTLKEELTVTIKRKAEDANEECFKFLDEENHLAIFYNDRLEVVLERPMFAEEYQTNIFQLKRIKDGTND